MDMERRTRIWCLRASDYRQRSTSLFTTEHDGSNIPSGKVKVLPASGSTKNGFDWVFIESCRGLDQAGWSLAVMASACSSPAGLHSRDSGIIPGMEELRICGEPPFRTS